jgi:Asp-tRNA(Asn)/Glu-tRNA(Gln) amidotransferase A subunit family amidase
VTDPAELNATTQARLIREGRLSAVELVDATLGRVAKFNPTLNAFITVMGEQALADARAADEVIRKKGPNGPLHGVPIALKDNIETAGIKTTGGSRLLEDYQPTRDATVVRKLREAGAIIIGKTHLSELGLGPQIFGDVHNPWNTRHTAGYSSSGSGSAVAGSLCPVALGHDTGGSIRIPSAFCGLVGLKATYGRVSRYGVLPLNWSFDHIGPMARSVADAALVLTAIAGHDPADASSSTNLVPDFDVAVSDLKGLRIGIPQEMFFDDVDPEIERAVWASIEILKSLGAVTREISTPMVRHTLDIGNIIQGAEATAYHEEAVARYPEKFHPFMLERLEGGHQILATDYIKAQRLRKVLHAEFVDVLRTVDVIITPTTRITAPEINQTAYTVKGKNIDLAYAVACFTFPFNQTGLPAINMPCGFSNLGLPIGMQIVGRHFDEASILKVAAAYEGATEWHKRRPVLEVATA